MVVWLEIENWVICKGSAKREWKGWGLVGGEKYGGCLVLWPLCVLGYIYAVALEDACVWDYRRLGCTVGTGS
jgi:hypothetical protein